MFIKAVSFEFSDGARSHSFPFTFVFSPHLHSIRSMFARAAIRSFARQSARTTLFYTTEGMLIMSYLKHILILTPSLVHLILTAFDPTLDVFNSCPYSPAPPPYQGRCQGRHALQG